MTQGRDGERKFEGFRFRERFSGLGVLALRDLQMLLFSQAFRSLACRVQRFGALGLRVEWPTLNPKPETLNPQTPNPKPQTSRL